MKTSKHTLALAAILALGFGTAAQAQVAVRDAQTGQLRAPTATEARALQPKASAGKDRVGMITGRINPGEVRYANGAIGQELDASTLVYSVVQIGADGSRSMVCATGEDGVQAALKAPQHSFARRLVAQGGAQGPAKIAQEQKYEVQ